MTLFAPVGPPKLLKGIRHNWGDEALGYYHLVLVHDIVENAEDWKGVLPKESTVILDNSFVELNNRAASLDTILHAYDILAREGFAEIVIVPPETFNDPTETIQQLEDSMEVLFPRVDKAVELMYVLQGHSTALIDIACFKLKCGKMNAADTFERVRWIGIPRTITAAMGSRYHAILGSLQLKLEFPDIKIHLLGLSNNIRDDIFCCQQAGVGGIDSAVPLRLGQQKREIDLMFDGDQAGPRGDYWNETEPHSNTFRNMVLFRRRIRSLDYSPDPLYVPRLKELN